MCAHKENSQCSQFYASFLCVYSFCTVLDDSFRYIYRIKLWCNYQFTSEKKLNCFVLFSVQMRWRDRFSVWLQHSLLVRKKHQFIAPSILNSSKCWIESENLLMHLMSYSLHLVSCNCQCDAESETKCQYKSLYRIAESTQLNTGERISTSVLHNIISSHSLPFVHHIELLEYCPIIVGFHSLIFTSSFHSALISI